MNPQDQPPVPMQTAAPATQPLAPVAPASAPAVAEDNDVIEYEWVKQAEAIVAKTQHDPHAQAQALAELKADYMQKRYAKTIKVVKE